MRASFADSASRWLRKRPEGRFWEVDLVRGLAIIMMIAFHTVFDLHFFGLVQLDPYSGWQGFLAYATAIMFLGLVGVSLSLSHARASLHLRGRPLFWKYLARGGRIFILGLVITLATWICLGRGFVIFGVLHCIGFSIILAYPFLSRRSLSMVTAIPLIILGVWLYSISFDFSFLLWLGFAPADLYSVDYFPLLPWFGVVLLGLVLGGWLYPKGQRRYEMPSPSRYFAVGGLAFLGRYSLIIYFLHQLVLIGAISLIA